MNNTREESKKLIKELIPLAKDVNCKVVICVPYTSLETAIELTKGTNIEVGAQNCHFKDSGAYTGEISAKMLKELGVKYVILGHSERRQYFNETDLTVNRRVHAALREGLIPIICVGESLKEREDGIMNEVISIQVSSAYTGIRAEQAKDTVIAYEPVWAIGTGKTATDEQAEEVCALIRRVMKDHYGDVANDIPIQYGGSMNAANAAGLLAKPNIDGGLIGGASLKAKDFAVILNAAG
jgi:triosephosphate isomerase